MRLIITFITIKIKLYLKIFYIMTRQILINKNPNIYNTKINKKPS